MEQVDLRNAEIAWHVSECVGRLCTTKIPGAFYWNVKAVFGDTYQILACGILHSKVEALTRARGRARFYRSEKERAR